MNEDSWFSDPDKLLNEVRRCEAAGFVVKIPGYDSLDPIARGGQGTVYRSVQLGTGRDVAIKIMFEGATNVVERRRRFEREVELASSLEHQNIVRIYDGGTLPNGSLYTVMEFIDGVPLDEFVASSALTKTSLVSLFAIICDAISYAHRRGVIHRDLKPSNILVTEDRQPQVLDFGIARCIGEASPTTRTGEFVGTLGYASPEQISGSPNAIDTRSDVYSLGVILYRLLTQRAPYTVEGPIATVVNAIQTVDARPPSRVCSNSDNDLDAIVIRCLEKNADERYQSANALAADLRRYLTGDILDAKRDQTWYMLRKIIRRHRYKVAVATAAFLLLISFTAIVTSLWQRAVTEEQKTREINVFWEDTLGSVSPSQPDQPITFQDVLDEAVHWVAITTENRPEVEASLRTTIGNGYRNIGLFEKAETQLQRSLTVRRQLHSDRHVDVIQSLNSIALLRKSEGNIEAAERGFLETLDAREALLGGDHPDVAMSLQNLGRVAMENGRLAKAAEYFDRALNIRKRHFAANNPAIATVYFNQGDLAKAKNELERAIELHQQALSIRKSRLAETHPDIARSLIRISQLMLETGQPEQAHQFATDALRLRRETLPADHLLIQEVKQLLERIVDEKQ